MEVLFFIVVLLICIVLAFFVLIQNPEGGGLSSSIGGFSNQIMGVKKTNNVLERGTWLFAGVLSLLCLISVIMFSAGGTATQSNTLQKLNTNVPAAQTKAPIAAPQQATPTAPATTPEKK